MHKAWRVPLLAALVSMPHLAADGPPEPVTKPSQPPADFKLVIELFGVRKTPLATSELVVRNGIAYQFITERPEEVTVIEPSKARLVLLDLKRRVQSEVTAQRLDSSLNRVYRRLSAEVERQEKSETRADKVAAAISRDLIDPRFTATFDPATYRLTLSNPSVEVEAVGEPEPDPARLALITNCLAAVTKVGTLRDPEGLPPFTRLDALRTLAAVHKLRPTQITYLYRLTGPPRKLRWSYRLVAELTDREREALTLVDKMRATARPVPYERFEEAEAR